MTIYFDNAATTKVKIEVLREMIPYFNEEFGNPSSIYHVGRKAKRVIEESREKVSNIINADRGEIYFTAGGSESDNTALKGFVFANKEKGNHIITTKIEHPAILDTCASLEKQGYEVTYLNVDSEGKISLEEFENSITSKTIFVSIMFANNEIGTIQPIKAISEITKNRGIVFHTDAVQAIGNVNINVKEMGIDMLSMSGHKIYGPKGVGALYVKKGIEFEKFINGGHQEKNKRAGTENLAGIVGIGKACELALNNLDEHARQLSNLRNYYIKKVKENIKGIKINGPEDEKYRLPGNSNISFKDIDGMALLLELDKKGICVSTGSACTSGDSKISHVLKAIGIPEEYERGALRVTFGEFNREWEIDFFIQNLKEIIERLRNL